MNLDTMASPNDTLEPVTAEAPVEQRTYRDLVDRLIDRRQQAVPPSNLQHLAQSPGWPKVFAPPPATPGTRVWDLPDPAVKGAEKMKDEAISRLVNTYRAVSPGALRDGVGIALEVIKTLDPAKVAE